MIRPDIALISSGGAARFATRGGPLWRIATSGRLFSSVAVAVCLVAAACAEPAMSESAPLAARTLLLGIANSGDKLVAVGDYGIVVVSRDNGRTWTQILAPTRTLLTGVSFPDARHGWAVGHDGVILVTSDGSQTWQRQDDATGHDRIFLDVLFLNATRGFAVGAYGLFWATTDAGQHWAAEKPSANEGHFNRLTAGSDGALYLAGESGALLISRDGGHGWTAAPVPYDGSLFGLLPLDRNALLVYGLRGHILRSADGGASWEPKNADLPVLLMAGALLKNGTIVLAGQGGNFLISRDVGLHFTPWKPAGLGTSVAALVEADDGAIVTVGEAGAVRLELP